MKKLVDKLKYILVVPDTFEPDDLRRRRVLNDILLFIAFVVLALAISEFWNADWAFWLQYSHDPDVVSTLIGVFGSLGLSALLWVLNRSSHVPKNLVGWIFVTGLFTILAVGDTPFNLTSGRSIFAWAIPVTLSVVVLPPASVFIVDIAITAAFWYYSGFSWSTFQTYTLTEIYVVSFISWLGMSVANKALSAARNESRKNAAILEGVAEGVIVLGPSHQIVLANRAASELLGTEMANVMPMTESVEINGRSLSFRWSEVEGVGWVAIMHDISRQIEIDHAKDAILRVVSHEMRTPLASILGFAEVLQSRPVPGMALRIQANAQRMLKLVDDLLNVAQIQAGAFAIHKEPFSPSILISYMLENFMQSAGEKGIGLSVHNVPSLPEHVTGDVQRLEQVVSNLVENAIKFTEKGGRVDVSICAVNSRHWQIMVRDTGIGIPPERLADIFEPFRRASDYARRKHQGIGLGLSIVKRIVELSGGNICVESSVGDGTTFTVTLPIEAETS